MCLYIGQYSVFSFIIVLLVCIAKLLQASVLLVMDMDSLSGSDWAWLPKHLLDTILDKLVSLSNYVHFGAVCREWQSVVMEKKCCTQVPFLMVPTEDNSEERRSLYSITHNKLYDFQLRVPYKKRLSGSSHGWLFTVEESFALTLINPFSGAMVELPPIMDRSIFEPQEIEYDSEDDFEYVYTPVEVEFEVMKATLSADPASSPNNYIVSAIYDDQRRLAFILPGDKAWTYIDQKFTLIHDVIYYRGQILAVDYWSGIIMVDLNRRAGESKVPQVEVIAPRTYLGSERRMYLVESSSGDLLLVERFLKYGDDSQHSTFKFKVFKMLLQQTEKGLAKRVEVKSLGGDSLFLGDNHSICVSASKWPGCRPNSIYYTDDYIDILHHLPDGRRDVGIFNIENGSFGTHYILDPSHKHMPPSIWIVPTMSRNSAQNLI
ncbi:putative F-box protein At5g55150 isoform X2 [Cornus florida]|uniref:putative F-box protein At5g55150 isoform X2 n=1 Tax=Cornus florida TaxID=4283 RepID=UPI00289B53E8|nr:putative F-box protein At5g55150 isoform X2 [Cornus florida]